MSLKKYKPLYYSLILLAVFGLGFFVDQFFYFFTSTQSKRTHVIRESNDGYAFIDPLLAVGDPPTQHSYKALEASLKDIIEQAQKNGQVDSASIYLRDLKTSQWLGVNEDEKYALASMYKLPLMITVVKEAEKNPELFFEKVIYDVNPINRAAPAETNTPEIELGKAYSVSELIRRMIIYSDNDAKAMLAQVVTPEAQQKIFEGLSIEVPDPEDYGDSMSIKTFSLFFRILYNASYLTHDNSEAALELLSKTTFKNGIVAGVPTNVKVSHKYGVRNFLTSEGETVQQQLHDCGIVYHSQNPYLVCIATKGKEYQNLASLIKKISEVAYSAADQNYK